MKIVAVTPHVLSTPLEEPFAFSQGWVERRGALVVEVATDEGVTGWGRLCATGCSRPRSPPP
jgi:D-galactarolactone cycloisomerase